MPGQGPMATMALRRLQMVWVFVKVPSTCNILPGSDLQASLLPFLLKTLEATDAEACRSEPGKTLHVDGTLTKTQTISATKETAEVIGKSEVATRVALSRAQTKLKLIMQKHHSGEATA